MPAAPKDFCMKSLTYSPLDYPVVIALAISKTTNKFVQDPKADVPKGITSDNMEIFGSSTITRLILRKTGKGELLGANKLDEALIYQSVDNSKNHFGVELTKGGASFDDALINFNKEMTLKTFVVSNYFTVADIFIYSKLYTPVSKMGSLKRRELVNLVRYFDLCQNLLKQICDNKLPTRYVEIDLEYVPSPKEKKDEKIPDAKSSKKENSDTKADSKDSKKDKKEKKPPAPAPTKAPICVSRIEFRVGLIKSVSKHPEADSLYVEQVDVGEPELRTVVSGLVKHMKEDELLNKKVVLVCNLKPAKMRGIESKAMVLCANSGDKVELISPPSNSSPGQQLFFKPGPVDKQLKSKEKIWETFQPKFLVGADGKAGFVDDDGKVFVLNDGKGGECVSRLIGGNMK